MRPRKVPLLLIAAVLAAPAVIAAHGLWGARQLTRASSASIPQSEFEEARRELPGLEAISFRTSDGLLLRGWYSPGSNGAVVILVHGGWGDRRMLLPDARILARHGYGLLMYDSRAQGESEGAMVSWGDREQRDVFAALDFLGKQPKTDLAKIAVLGFSIGASTASLAAARDPRIRAVILYATWTSLADEMHRNHARYGPLSWIPALFMLRHRGVDIDNVRPIDHIREISPRPLLMIAGTLDDDTPVPVMEKLFTAAGEPKQLWVEPGAAHGTYVAADPGGYEARVIPFLDHALQIHRL